MTKPTYIVASPFKTGTSSIAKALVLLGAGCAPMPYRGDVLADIGPSVQQAHWLVRPNMSFDAFRARHGDEIRAAFTGLLAVCDGFDIFHDAPIGHSHLHPFILKTLMPRARLIWVKRPKAGWLESVRKWEVAHPDVYPHHAKWHTDKDDMVAQKIRRRMVARRGFAAFRRACPDDAVVLDWADLGHFDRLANFCGRKAPDEPFPHCNRS
ncbi:hypothetical protein L0664_07775 [Octadecabacter sp. G9-8]|uniref:Sulfotransferase family protein n=1 Tax=Octadecabacter dasysiphoniae TaxID=2909341 RepID=A0ABS9CX47_9RHOB|nr:sulfotransferase [Octadecabacter dasysiphoniae]MCF2870960.1 hypothetical protein [Octadecabacter dasysiphoniae]